MNAAGRPGGGWVMGAAWCTLSAMGLRTVLLRHTLSDGSWHYDWLIERATVGTSPERVSSDDPDPRVLVSFRTLVRVDEAMTCFEAVRVGDHRRSYLDYEGPISRDRGVVVRVASGVTAGFDEEDPMRPRVVVRFDREAEGGDGPARPGEGGVEGRVGEVVEWVGRAMEGGDTWRFERGEGA